MLNIDHNKCYGSNESDHYLSPVEISQSQSLAIRGQGCEVGLCGGFIEQLSATAFAMSHKKTATTAVCKYIFISNVFYIK